jgi:hypothetical protein
MSMHRQNKSARMRNTHYEMSWFQRQRKRMRRRTELQKASRKKNRGTR